MKKSIIKTIIVNFAGIFSSRILGFIRDLLSADILGANIYSDIFFVAFKFPNLFRRIFAEGAFTQSFLPSFAKTPYKPAFAWKIFTYLIVIIFILTLIVNLFAYPVTDVLAYGFSPEAKKMAAPLVAINFWYLDLIFVVTFFASLLQYKNHFATTAFSTGLLNIALISALLFSMHLPKKEIIFYLSVGVVIGGIAQVIAHLIAAKKYGILKMLAVGAKSRKKPEINTFKKQFLPSVFGNSTVQISAFVDTWLATFLSAGSISYLYYANRLFQLPLALLATSASTSLFPKITRHVKNGEGEEALKILKTTFWFVFWTLSFAVIVGIVDAREFVRILFQRGAFNAEDTRFTSMVLVMYLIGLLPSGINKLFQSYLYAEEKHGKVAKYGAVSIFVNVIFSLILIFPLKVYGLALAGSISAFVLFFLNLREFGFDRFFSLFEKKYFFWSFFLIIISFLIAFLIKYAINIWL